MSSRRFGVSTHLYHDRRLERDHLVEIAAHGFESIELFATRTHFDYHDRLAVLALAEWLEDTRLTLHSVHAPINASLVDGHWGSPFSNAVTDEARRRQALTEAEAALAIANAIPYRHLVVHLGVPDDMKPAPSENHREAAHRSVDTLQEMCARVDVQMAIEVIPNRLSTPESLVTFIEEDLDGARIGICMDVGHAHLMGDLGDAIEACSGHIVTTHLHDNRRKTDDHLIPGAGTIDWPAALMELQKVGYDGPWMFEVANTSTPKAVLEQVDKARKRFERLLDMSFENPQAF
ncbi:MAG: sugar phosphate isomerase/epimerase [Acidobacteria bacterium]|nr:sugar phosphate isomerase/epimerase [Acidobacteriota bacterium]